MAQTVDFFYDLVSPFAHVALARLSDLPADVEIRPVPVLLGPILAHWGQKGPAEISAKRLHTYRLSVFLGQQSGLEMVFPPRHPFNPLAAQRVLAGGDADLKTVRRAFDFVFQMGRAPDNETDLKAFADHVGLPVALSVADESKARLRANTDAAISAGIFGVPSFSIATPSGAENFWGVDAMPMLAARLADEAFFERDPYKPLERVENGITRKIG